MKEYNTSSEEERITEVLDAMRATQGEMFSLEKVNLAELERRTGVSRARLRRLKENGFEFKPHGNKGRKAEKTVLTGYTGTIDTLLIAGVTNSSVILERLQDQGFLGSLTVVKEYIAAHRNLVPAKRQLVAPQGNRGRRYTTKPGESFQMDWGFVKVQDPYGNEYTAACFAMICHHCGERYIEFFPNARQENLFIGMIHAFNYMGIPEYVLTDNMKSVVIRRDLDGRPVWQADYEAFMKKVGFKTKLCKPRHPFTKGKVERLVRFVKDNFIVGRTFWNVTDLNRQALDWCDTQNNTFHKATFVVPHTVHMNACAPKLRAVSREMDLRFYLCPPRRISFDGFINYESRRFGVPYWYKRSVARVMRKDDLLHIYSDDLSQLLVTHEVTWSLRDQYCADQYSQLPQPEEYPSMPVTSTIKLLQKPVSTSAFDKFDFDKGVNWDD